MVRGSRTCGMETPWHVETCTVAWGDGLVPAWRRHVEPATHKAAQKGGASEGCGVTGEGSGRGVHLACRICSKSAGSSSS